MLGEDSGLLRQLVADLFTRHGCTVTGQAGDAATLLRLVDADPPDVAVLDIRMPPSFRDEGIVAAERIRSRHPRVGVLVLSHYAETGYAIRLLEHVDRGVGYLLKDRVQDGAQLLDAARRVAAGELVLDPEVVRRVLARRRLDNPLDRLTAGERQVLALVAEGLSNTGIARRLYCSAKTVEKRVTAIAQKLALPVGERAEVNIRVMAVLRYLRTVEG